MKNFFTTIRDKSLRRINLIIEKHHWTSVGVITVLIVIALFFILSGISQQRVSVFAQLSSIIQFLRRATIMVRLSLTQERRVLSLWTAKTS